MTTTIKLSGGDLGSEKMYVRCDLTRAEKPVEVDYCEGSGWESTQWQCASCSHRTSGLIAIGKELAAQAVQMDEAEFSCDARIVENRISIYADDVWAGDGRLSNGHIEDCAAILGGDQDTAEEIYEAIEEAIAANESEYVRDDVAYTWSLKLA